VSGVCHILNVIWLKDLDSDDHWIWLLSILIAILLNWLVFDVISVLLAKSSNMFFKIFRNKGYYYDKDLHDEVALRIVEY